MSTEKLLLFRKWDLSEIEIKDQKIIENNVKIKFKTKDAHRS